MSTDHWIERADLSDFEDAAFVLAFAEEFAEFRARREKEEST